MAGIRLDFWLTMNLGMRSNVPIMQSKTIFIFI
jgi:hypothetical protein